MLNIFNKNLILIVMLGLVIILMHNILWAFLVTPENNAIINLTVSTNLTALSNLL